MALSPVHLPSTGSGVGVPRIDHWSTALKAGSRVLTVCVSEMATAAKERFAAIWPKACMDAGPEIFFSSSPVMGLPKEAFLNPKA